MKFHSGIETLKALPALFTEKTEALGAFRKKTLEYLVLFTVLGIIYYWQLKPAADKAVCTEINIDLALGWVMLKFIGYTGWPFALLAYLDGTWRNKDAANVFLAAYIATNAYWIHKSQCGVCMLSLPFRMLPYVMGALVGHRIGAWPHAARGEE